MKKVFYGIVVLVVSVIAGFIFVTNVNADGTWNGGADDSDTSASPCTTGNCVNPWKNGGFWVNIPADSDDIPFSSLYGVYFSYLFEGVQSKSIFNCLSGGGSAYLLVTEVSNGTIAGGVGLNVVYNNMRDTTWANLPAGMVLVPHEVARQKFQDHEADFYYPQYGQRWNADSELTWFCAEPSGPFPSSRRVSSEEIHVHACGAERDPDSGDFAYADTKTRIAVQNMTLDGSIKPTKNNGTPNEWKASSSPKRYNDNFRQDSGWTDKGTGGDVIIGTTAKPGDSIRFYHAICMAARYARRTPTQGSHVDPEKHDTEYSTLPAQHAEIGAIPSNYLFKRDNVVSSVNSQLNNVSKHSPNLFSDPGKGSSVDATRSSIDLLQPTDSGVDYNCESAPARFADYNTPWISGGYQIPGFDNGSCTASDETGITNPVGTEIIQYHTFDSAKVWESYSHSVSGKCACQDHGTNEPSLTNNPQALSYTTAKNGNRKEYKCNDYSNTLDCEPKCPDGMENDDGTCSVDKVPTKHDYKGFTDDSNKFMHVTKHSFVSGVKKEAHVYIPYNYDTKVYSSLDVGDYVFQGTSVESVFQWKVTPRKNKLLRGAVTIDGKNKGYATVTPSTTKVRFIEFILKPGSRNTEGIKYSTKHPCKYYKEDVGGINCVTIDEKIGNQNVKGKYTGAEHHKDYKRAVPDNEELVGYKYCVAVGIYPGDSHNGTNNTLKKQYSYGEDGAMDAGETWNISGAACRTIAKKPNFQVWNGSIYTEDVVKTSLTKKMVGQASGPYDSSEPNARYFGSWVDYGLYVGGKNGSVENINNTMASGATLGYQGYTLKGPGGRMHSETTVRKLSPQTASNIITTNSNGIKNTSPSGMTADSSIKTNLTRLTTRYRDKAQSFAIENATNSQKAIRVAKTGMKYVYYNGNTTTKELQSYVSDTGAGALAKDANGNITLALGDGQKDNTLVIYVNGDLTISGNICYGSCSGDPTKLIDYATGTQTSNTAALPQALIFANNIYIDESVGRVDAWLIADDTINTCAGHNVNNLVARDAKQVYVNGFGGNCSKTLVVNGPVITKKLELLRTAGANHGAGDNATNNNIPNNDPRYRVLGATNKVSDAERGSASPAEIFNFRADAYLWAYNQAQRYSEAVVTYMRELPPRY